MPVKLTTNRTPQTEHARRDQTQNAAGGFAWELDKWQRLDRFLILGTEGGTLYATQGELSRENTRNLRDCVAEDANRALGRVIEVSDGGLAHKNDYALFALAIIMSEGDPEARAAAGEALPKVARTASHLFTFIHYATSMRGWGRTLRNAVARWYNRQHADHLEYQMVKYQARAGWTHRDALRVSHPTPPTEQHRALYAWATQGTGDMGGLIAAMRTAHDGRVLAALADEPSLPREALPTEALADPMVWDRLLGNGMPMTAMVRNLATMTRVGLLKPLSDAENTIVQKLADEEALRKSRMHPIQILAALVTYARGRGARGKGEWEPSSRIVAALDAAFYRTFANVEPTNKRTLLALDVSGSMSAAQVGGVPGLTARMGAAALALVTAATEPRHAFVAFQGDLWRRESSITPLSIAANDSLKDVVHRTEQLPFGPTDCAAPMQYALENGLEVDAFVVLTDSETWAGRVHPFEALREYRRRTGIPAKLAVVGMTSGGFTIADPNDAGMLDLVGFDPSTPRALSTFMRE